MRLFVTVKPRARTERIEPIDATHFAVSVTALPIDGKANDAVRRALARHLGVPANRLVLRSGAAGKRKVFELETA
ncbi:MAG: DUF167 domain-containing protein [Candidatus Moraniibacteriota bacterium]|nr:MAG: DUF167 domain-containing protein [Candidatus Moranbacteria bacterium]